jgi:6-pyruvoyltetrahydropterin/6-carboxytetrahydropterin synthase
MKGKIKEMIDSFDHSTTIWNRDDKDYIEAIKKHSQRWIELPLNPSAEQFSRLIFLICDMIMKTTEFSNGENEVEVYSVIVHETDTGYAQAFREDISNIDIEKVIFSKQIMNEWSSDRLWDTIKKDYYDLI